MTNIPMRNRTSKVSNEEKRYYAVLRPEKAKEIENGSFFEEEIDIPAHYKLEKRIIKDLLEEADLESAYKIVESKRGMDFANKLREESKDDGISYTLKNGKDNIISTMKKFLAYVDELNSIYQEYSPCKKGCSSCCDIPVAISDLEAIIIKEYLDKNNIKYQQLNSLKAKQENAGKNELIGAKYTGIRCPFLKDDNCSIYPVRPFNCRKFIIIGLCDMKGEYNYVGVGYIIGMTYNLIVARHIRKNLKRYISILSPEQIRVTEEGDLNGVYNLRAWQNKSDIRDNFSKIS